MSSIELAVKHSKKLEACLETKFGASGKGLHEKATSVENKLPSDTVRALRRIATMRNKAVHEDGFEIRDTAEFVRFCDATYNQLEALGGTSSSSFRKRYRPPRVTGKIANTWPDDGPSGEYSDSRRHRVSEAAVGKRMGFAIAVVVAFLILLAVSNSNRESQQRQIQTSQGSEYTVDQNIPTHPFDGSHQPPKQNLVVTTGAARPNIKKSSRRAEKMASPSKPAGLYSKAMTTTPSATSAVPAATGGNTPAAENGDGVYLRRNTAIQFKNAYLTLVTGTFGDSKWKVRATVKNISPVTLSFVTLNSTVYLPGHRGSARNVGLTLYLGSSGLAPGQSTSVTTAFSFMHGAYKIATPAFMNAATLGVVFDVQSVTDGMGKDYGPEHKFEVPKAPVAKSGYRAGNGFVYLKNNLISFSNVQIKQTTNFFGTAWRMSGDVRNLTNGYLEMVDTKADVYVPGKSVPFQDVKQTIFFGQNGLGAHQSTHFSVKLGGDGMSGTSIDVPDVINAHSLGVRLRVTGGANGLGNSIN